MKHFKRAIAALLLCALLAAGLCACGKDKKTVLPDDAVILTVNGKDVPFELYRYFFFNYKADEKTADLTGDNAAVTYERIHENCVNAIEAVYASLALSADYGITPEDANVKTLVEGTISAIKEQYIDEKSDPKGEKGFADALGSYCMTEKVLRLLTAVDECESATMTKMLEKGEILSSDADVRAAIEGDGFVRVKHILISDTNGESDESNRRLAEEVRNKALSGTDFDTLVANYSNDYAMTKDGYYLPRGYVSADYEKVAFSLSVGEVSEAVHLSDGYYVILCCEKDPAYIDANFTSLKETYQECRFFERLDAKKASIKAAKTELFYSTDWTTLEK